MSDLAPSARRALDGRDPVETDRRNRRRYDDPALRELGFRLGLDRAQVRGRGHEWDVADIMAVVAAWQDEQGLG